MLVRLKMRSKIFSGSGDLKIKCTAAIDPIYWKSSEESIQVMVMILVIIEIMMIHKNSFNEVHKKHSLQGLSERLSYHDGWNSAFSYHSLSSAFSGPSFTVMVMGTVMVEAFSYHSSLSTFLGPLLHL